MSAGEYAGGYFGPFYWRRNRWTFFLLPTIGVGVDAESGLPFFEIGWGLWCVGIGSSET